MTEETWLIYTKDHVLPGVVTSKVQAQIIASNFEMAGRKIEAIVHIDATKVLREWELVFQNRQYILVQTGGEPYEEW